MGDWRDIDAAEPLHCARLAIREGLRLCIGRQQIDPFLSSPDFAPRRWARSWKRWSREKPGTLLRLPPAALARTPRLILWGAAIACALGDAEDSRRRLASLGIATEEGDEALERRIDDARRNHEPDGARLRELTDEGLHRGRAACAFAHEGLYRSR